MRNLYLISAVLFAFLAFSCGTSPEAQKNQWNSNKKRLTRLQTDYPNFKAALQQVMTDAEAKWKEAEGVSGEDAQIKAMQAANSAASPTFVRDLDGLRKKMEKLKDVMTDAQQASGDQADANAAKVAAQEAMVTLNQIEREVKTASANTVAAANTITSKWTSNLKSATDRLEKVMKKAKEKQTDAEKDAQAKEDQAKADKEATEKAKEPIKCEYCGVMNKPTALKCSGCGAPIEKK